MKPNPDAQPVATSSAEDDDAIVPEDAPAPAAKAGKPKPTTYDFYTLLPSNEVALSDAELAETERAEAERQRLAQQQAEPATQAAVNATNAPADTAATWRRRSSPLRMRRRRHRSPKRPTTARVTCCRLTPSRRAAMPKR